jgi:hypothetical protein
MTAFLAQARQGRLTGALQGHSQFSTQARQMGSDNSEALEQNETRTK